jgi:hypothetical protein
LAFHGAALGLPAPLVITNGVQCVEQIALDASAGGCGIRLHRRNGSAIAADERLLGRIPVRLGSATRAMKFLMRGDFAHGSGIT